jgi:hypothetical protein
MIEANMEQRHMRRAEPTTTRSRWATIPGLVALAAFTLGCFPPRSLCQQPGQATFSTPELAANALFTAAQNNDEKAMLDLLGPDGKQIVSSGDETEDANSRANFVRRYQEMHRLVKEPDGTVSLYIGARNWPTPIPLVHKANSWYFDTDMGKKEILFRRIGRNEISTIRVCRELVAAEKEYRGSGQGEYAQKIVSDAGQHNGLYWRAGAGEPQSPIGPLVAAAVAEGYASAGTSAAIPYRGYYFHVLTGQGRHASGGIKRYVVNGKMIEGFAFVAYPAEYRSSGVMTFTVGGDGIVHEKDLGRETGRIAKAMTTYDPDSSWKVTEEVR